MKVDMNLLAEKSIKGVGTCNEDGFYFEKGHVIMLDGATGLGNKRNVVDKIEGNTIPQEVTDAKWFVNGIIDNIKNGMTVENSIQKIKNSISFEIENKWEVPSAGFAIVELFDGNINIKQLGDVPVWIVLKNGTIEKISDARLKKLDKLVTTKMKELSTKLEITCKQTRNLDEINEMLKVNRSKLNSKDSDAYEILSLFEFNAKSCEYSIPMSDVKNIILATDGFYESYESFIGNIDCFVKEVIRSEQPQKIVDEVCGNLERMLKDDNDWKTMPRFKDMDDMTVAVISLNS